MLSITTTLKCEYFRHVADDFEPKDNQIICSSLTRQEMVEAMRAGGVDPETFPVIVGKPERGSKPAGIVVLGVGQGAFSYAMGARLGLPALLLPWVPGAMQFCW